MKKLLSIGLAIIILLGVIFVTVSAAEAKPAVKDVKVLLDDGIALKFTFKGLSAGKKYTINLVSSEYQTTVTAVADKNGEAYGVYHALTPAMFELNVTATLVEENLSRTASVMEYCDWALGNMYLSDEVHTLVADLLNYAAAAQTYLNPESPTVADLSAVQQNIASVVPVRLKNAKATDDQTGKALTWVSAAPLLGESVAYRFRFSVADEATLNGLNFTATISGKTYKISQYKKDNISYYVDFTYLTPANLLEDVVMVAKNGAGEEISVSKLISMDRYTSWVRSNTSLENHEELCALVNAVLAYAKGSEKYVESGRQYADTTSYRDISSGTLTDSEIFRLSGISMSTYDGSAYNGSFAEAMYNKAGLSVGGVGLNGVTVSTVYNALSSTYAGVLVEGSLGGTSRGSYPFLAQKNFEVGDLLYAKVPISGDNNPDTTYSYWTALYLGEGKFLLETSNQSDMEITYADLKSYLLDGNKEIADENSNVDDDQVATVGKAEYYFALRPSLAAKETQATPSNTVTRAEMENALKETLWAYYAKGEWAQYESTTFNAISYTHGGYSPLGNHLNTLEDATEQNVLYSVCSNYAWCAYYEALGYPLFGNYLNPASAYLWIFADELAADADGDSLVVMRWHNYPCDFFAAETDWDYDDEDKNSTHIAHSEEICCGYGEGSAYNLQDAHDALVEFFTNYEENLRPGDIIRLPGHVVVYAGDGWILEAGGSKYDKEFGFDGVDTSGVIHATKIMDYFFPEEDKTSFRLQKYYEGAYKKSDITVRNLAGICVLRPLDLLTIDDGDGDPSNDLLNIDYYNDGVKFYNAKGEATDLTWQLEHDTVELPHTGYNIMPATYTRMYYPMMNINRTVDVGVYGTAVKGETITYTVEIRNQSNDPKYITTRINGYTGQDYFSVPITETIPANVELVSAEGATLSDGVLYWEIDVPAGESVSVSYTVRVTGEMGAEIVNDGGFVGTIPSNTLVNTIGGQNLSTSVENAFLAFYEAGKDMWNSNNGYKISASFAQEGSLFAEQIYNAVGLDLDLPELEDLLKTLFFREYIEIPRGGFHGYDDDAASWMFTLNDTTANAEDQVWRDMIINGRYFGGNYVWTNNFDKETRRVSIPRTSDLQPGDIIIGMDISNVSYEAYAYKIADWKVIVYLGNDKYASLTSDGVLSACDGPRELISSIVWDVFIGLRPSQAFENVNEELYSGKPATLTDADIAWQAISPSTVTLNTSFGNAIKGITSSAEYGLPMIGDVYAQAGLDVNTNALGGLTYKTLTFLLFNDLASESEYGHEYHLLEQAVYGYESVYNMLMFYEGAAYVNDNPLVSMDDLQEGDAIVLGRQIGKIQQVMIYQGSGKFLMSTTSPIGGFYLNDWQETRTFADVDALLAYLNGEIVKKDGSVVQSGKYWEGYLVLRPARGFSNINTRVVRDLADCQLTAEEKTVLSRLPATSSLGSTYNSFIKWAYGQAMIDVGDRFALKNNEGNVANNMFYYGVFNDSCVRTNSDTDFANMLVEGSWGGTKFVGKNKQTYQLALEDYRVGDIFIGRYSSSGSVYRAAIYQGNNRFLVFFGGYTRIIVCESEADLYGAHEWYYYFVLRPSQIGPRDPADKRLTDEEKQALSALTDTTMSDSSFNTFVKWAYMQADIDVSQYFNYQADNYYFYGSFKYSNEVASLVSDLSSYKVKMLVPNSWRGTYFTNSSLGEHTLSFADYEIGDIVVARYYDSSSVYRIAIYQGDNTFLVKSGKNVTVETYTSEEDICGNNDWQYFFVLRPNRLALATCGDSLTWELNGEGTLTISGIGAMDDFAEGKAPWYEYRDTIKTVVIENCVTRIGKYAFSSCTRLSSITIPASVTTIRDGAFNGCTSFTDVDYDDSMAQWKTVAIGSGNESLLNAVIHATDGIVGKSGICGENLTWELDENGTLTISGTGDMADYNRAPWYDYRDAIETVVIENGATSIGEYAFYGCTSLTSITIPNSVTGIGACAFGECSSLTSITIPDGVTYIGGCAFYYCASLTSVTIPGSVTNLEEHVFQDCIGLTSVNIQNGVTSIGEGMFDGCTSLTDITIPASVTSIEWHAFYNCYSLESINIPNSVANIGDGAFYGCTGLKDIFYDGTKGQWDRIEIVDDTFLDNVTLHATRKPIEIELPEWV